MASNKEADPSIKLMRIDAANDTSRDRMTSAFPMTEYILLVVVCGAMITRAVGIC